MSVSIRFADRSGLEARIRQLAASSRITMIEVLPSQMRLLAVDLAFNTEPYGKDAASANKLRGKIRARINSIYKPIGSIANKLGEKNPRHKPAFLRYIRRNELDKAAQMASRILGESYTVGDFDGGQRHKSVMTSDKLIVTDYKKVKEYTTKKVKMVGFAKSGFATAASQLGGTRGIPAYASKHRGPGSGIVRGSGSNVTVVMTNDVDYIANALSRRAEANAIEFRKKAMDKRFQRIFRAYAGRAIR